MTAVASAVAAVVAAVILIPLLAFASFTGGNPACLPNPGLAPATNISANSPAGPPAQAGPLQPGGQRDPQWDAEEIANAATIVAVGKTKAVPAWGWVIAVATAMQESRLRNLPGGDRDSIGLFQQRPSQGWGTPAQLASPAYQAARFYDALLAVPDWQHLPLTQAAQAVQRSAFPLAYAQWTRPAITLVNHLGSGDPSAIPVNLEQCLSNCPSIVGDSAAGLLRQQDTAIGSAEPSVAELLKNRQTTRSRSVLTSPEGAGQPTVTAHDQSEPTNQLSATTPIPAGAMPTPPSALPVPATFTDGCGPEADGLPAAQDVQLPAGIVVPPGTPPQAAAAIGWALQQLGAPYSWGGDCTAPHGPDPAHQCDCSSLVQAAYQHAGITLPRTTTQQVTAGIAIHDLAQLRPGDLIFIPGSLGTMQHPRHIGLYVGGPQGLIVHAPAPGQPTRLAVARQWNIAAVRRVVTG